MKRKSKRLSRGREWIHRIDRDGRRGDNEKEL
jgi:hypothetical protein